MDDDNKHSNSNCYYKPLFFSFINIATINPKKYLNCSLIIAPKILKIFDDRKLIERENDAPCHFSVIVLYDYK